METLAYSYYSSSYNAAAAGIVGLTFAALIVPLIIGLVVGLAVNMALTWGVYKKGGYKGFEGIVPIYNTYCLCKMAGVETVWFILSIFFPVVLFYVYIKLAERFNKGAGYGIGLALLPVVFFPMLGYGDAQYMGPNFTMNGMNNMGGQPMNGNMNNMNNGYNMNNNMGNMNMNGNMNNMNGNMGMNNNMNNGMNMNNNMNMNGNMNNSGDNNNGNNNSDNNNNSNNNNN